MGVAPAGDPGETPVLHPGRQYQCSTADGDPGQLRAVAREWRSAASELTTQVQVLDANVWFWSASWDGKGKQQFADVWVSQFAGRYSTNKHTSYSDPSHWSCPAPIDPSTGQPRPVASTQPMFEACIDGFLQMAQHLDDYADAIEQAREQQRERMIAIGAAVVVAVGVGILTFGVGDLVAGPAAAALVSAGLIAEGSLAFSVTTILATMVVSAVAGFVSSAAGDLAGQFFNNLITTPSLDDAWNHINWGEVGTAGGEGALSGLAAFGLGAAFGTALRAAGVAASVGSTIAVGSLTGLTMSVGSQLLFNGKIDLGETMLDTALGGVTAGLFHESPEPQWLSFQAADGSTVDIGIRPTGPGTFEVIDPDGNVLGQGMTTEQGFTARLTFDGEPLTLGYDSQTGAVTFGSLEPGGRAVTFSPVEVQGGQLQDGTPATVIRYEPTGGIQTDLEGGRTFFDANGNVSKTVSPEDVVTSYQDGKPVVTAFSDGTTFSAQNTVDAVPSDVTAASDPAPPAQRTLAAPASDVSRPGDAAGTRAPESRGAGWGAAGDGPVPTGGDATWTWETLPQSGTVQPNWQPTPPSAPPNMDADTAALAAPIFRNAVDAEGMSLVGSDGQIRTRFPVDFDPFDAASVAKTRDLVGALTWATGREWVLVGQDPNRIELILGDTMNVQVPSRPMFRLPDGELMPATGGVEPNVWLSNRWDLAHSHPFGVSHVPSWGRDEFGREWGDVPTLRMVGADRGWIIAHPTANPHDPWVTVEFFSNGDWHIVPPKSFEVPLKTMRTSAAYAAWVESSVNLTNQPSAPLRAVEPNRAMGPPARQIPIRPRLPHRLRLVPFDQPGPPRPGWEGPEARPGSHLTRTGESPGGYSDPQWVVDSQQHRYLMKDAATPLDTINEVLARSIQRSVGVQGPSVYFGGSPSDPTTPALVRDIQQSMTGSELQEGLTSVLNNGDVVRQSLEGPDPAGVLRNVIFDYLSNNLFDNNYKNVLVLKSGSGLQIVGIDYAFAFEHSMKPPPDPQRSFLDLLRAPEVWSIKPEENYAAHWLTLLGEALRGMPDGKSELGRQLDEVLKQYGNVDPQAIIARLKGDDLLPAGESGGITQHQEAYVREWLQEFETRRQWLLEHQDEIIQAIWKGDLAIRSRHPDRG